MMGNVLHIFVAPNRGAPMEPRDSVTAIAGTGLVGDRYAIQRVVIPAVILALVGVVRRAQAAGCHRCRGRPRAADREMDHSISERITERAQV